MRHQCCGSTEEHYTGCPLMEIEEYCADNYHAVRYSLIEDRAYAIICTKCQEKIQQLEVK